MLTDDLLTQLCFKGEGTDLDYKAERYLFSGASDEDKGEILKDILAMANAHRDGTAYILLGFRENSPHPADVVGLPTDGAIDDSRIQQFVNEKLESKLTFRYEERIYEGQHIAVISIPKQARPFYLKKDYGKLLKDKVYIRRGSSTDVASPREIAMMGVANSARPLANVDLEWRQDDNEPLAATFALAFYSGAADLPDYSTDKKVRDALGLQSAYIETHEDNRDFWRQAAEHVILTSRLVAVRIKVTNHSDFPLSGTKLEVQALDINARALELDFVSELPKMPAARWNIFHRQMDHMRAMPRIESSMSQVELDNREGSPLFRIRLGNLLPGESIIVDEDLAILPRNAGAYALKARLLANELNPPLTFEHAFEVEGDDAVLDVNRLKGLLFNTRQRSKGD
ncbi:ATP-binding protein [Stenotrophomonas aracearum]|uniref:ATP-binding protein n=1 Tax=Stenotrophomonas aracearum TaxID=3003272 RepID=A0ABY9Y988_9GAMM|nr:ATP-binding protein [Stenotrophomonas sp. A5588]WNH47242.1 ATP-binding protein [Stenotrophomonas sp. A5588]